MPLRMKLLGANPHAQMSGVEPLAGKVNYLIGNDPKQWRTGISTYARVKAADVYRGVDLVYYGNQRLLEYDFVVAPRANPGAIRLGFKGAKDVRVDAGGELVVSTADGELRWHKPLIYQEVGGIRRAIDGKYIQKGKNHVGFLVSNYDRHKTLVIDPVFYGRHSQGH